MALMSPMMNTTFETIIDDFAFLDDWDDRYKYVIDLGKQLPEFPDEARTEENRVRGCASQVWMLHKFEGQGPQATLSLQADSDAHIVRGLVAILLTLFQGKTITQINALDAQAALAPLDLADHLTPQRTNGLGAMIETIKKSAARENTLA